MTKNPNCVFITAYQERSSARSLAPQLERFGLSAQTVDLHTFLHPCHIFAQDELIFGQIGKCAKDPLVIVEMNSPSPLVDVINAPIEYTGASNLRIFRDIFLIRISFNSSIVCNW